MHKWLENEAAGDPEMLTLLNKRETVIDGIVATRAEKGHMADELDPLLAQLDELHGDIELRKNLNRSQ